MATDPAQVSSSTSSKTATRSEAFAQYLRTLPAKVSKDDLHKLVGRSPLFRDEKSLNSAVIYAQARGYLSLRDKNREMKNTLSGARSSNGNGHASTAATQTDASQAAPKKRRIGAAQTRVAQASENEQSIALSLVRDAHGIATRSLLDRSITFDALRDAVLKAGAAIGMTFTTDSTY